MKILLIGSEGYVGTFMKDYLLSKGHEITSCDLVRDDLKKSNHIIGDYSNLSIDVISQQNVVINLAGHSSVKKAQDEPFLAVENNSINLYKLALKCSNMQIPLIYASSGSIYSSINDSDYNLKGVSVNAYDGSKMAADLLLSTLNIPSVAMCFGTVSGWSRNLRNELVFNSMNISAYKDKQVNIWNGENLRSILFLDDMAKYVDIILEKLDLINKFCRIQLSSWSGSVNDLGTIIARHWNADIKMELGEDTYSFVLSDHAFKSIFQSQILKSDISTQCENLIKRLGIK